MGRGRNMKGQEDDKEEEVDDKKAKRERRWNWRNLHFWACPSWVRTLVPIAPVWLVLQEQIQPSLSALDAGGRMLLAGLLWTGFGLGVSLIHFLHQHRTRKQEMVSKNNKFATRTGQDQPARRAGQKVVETDKNAVRATDVFGATRFPMEILCCPISPQDANLVNALLDGMVVCLVQEVLSDPSLTQVRSLLSRLEVVSKAFNNSGLSDGQLLQAGDGMDRVKQVSTYLQDRMSALRSLIQVQDQYGTSMADVQQDLQELWDLLEGLHEKVKAQPEKSLEDPQTVLSNTESLYKQLGLFQGKVQECQSYLSASTHLIQELEINQHIMAHTVGLTPEMTWTKDFLQCNTEQFEKVHTHFTSLEQQTLTFVMHLHDLGLSHDESSTIASHVEHKPSLSPISSLPVYSIAMKNPNLGPDPESTPKSNWKLSALWSLCGTRRKK